MSSYVLKGLHSTKFLEILKSNKTPNKFSTDELKITLKHKNFVRGPFQICSKLRIPLDLKHLNFRIFSFILHHSTQTIYFNHKLNSLSPLRDVESDFEFVQVFFAAEPQLGSTLFLTLHEVLAFSCPVPGRVI